MSETSFQVAGRARVRWRNGIIAAFGLGGITMATWGPRLPALQASFDVGTATLGGLLAMVAVGSVGGLVAATPVSRSFGNRAGMAGSLGLVAVALAGLAVAAGVASVPLAGVAFLLVGLGIGVLDVLINVEGAAVEHAIGRTLMPLLHGSWSVGVMVGAGIGAGCAALKITVVEQFAGEAVAVVIAAVAIAGSIPARPSSTPQRPGGWWSKVAGWARGWTDARLLLIGVVMLGAEFGEGAANNWLTLAVRSDHAQPATIAALFFAAFAAAEASARIFGPPVVDRLGRVRTVRLTTGLGVVGAALFILGGSPGVVLAGVALWAVGVSMGFPLGMSAAASSGPDAAARVSVVASIGYVANLAGPPAIGVVAESVGLLNACWMIAALLIAASATAGSLRAAPRRG